jgi:hypothetical protein
VHARIGAPRRGERSIPLEDLREGGLDDLLHRAQPGLAGPAGEVGAVVLE